MATRDNMENTSSNDVIKDEDIDYDVALQNDCLEGTSDFNRLFDLNGLIHSSLIKKEDV